MTLEERLAELGVDLSDLDIDVERGKALYEKYYESAEAVADEKGIELNALLMIMLVLHDIAERDEIIDRMETRIVNLTGELNYIKQTFMDCATCTDGSVLHSDRCNSCDENYSNYEFAGILEDWRPDDDQ